MLIFDMVSHNDSDQNLMTSVHDRFKIWTSNATGGVGTLLIPLCAVSPGDFFFAQ